MIDKTQTRADELDIEDMIDEMHLRAGGAWALLGGMSENTPADRVAHAHEYCEKVWDLIPFLKALGRLALEHPERARQLWADALREPMPLGGAPIAMPDARHRVVPRPAPSARAREEPPR